MFTLDKPVYQCPHCNSNDWEEFDTRFTNTTMRQYVLCNDCNFEWIEKWELKKEFPLKNTKVVIVDYGTFKLSDEALIAYAKGRDFDWTWHEFPDENGDKKQRVCIQLYANDKYWEDVHKIIPRNDPTLVRIVEEMGQTACYNKTTQLKIVEIPDNIGWYIENLGDYEVIHEAHQIWN